MTQAVLTSLRRSDTATVLELRVTQSSRVCELGRYLLLLHQTNDGSPLWMGKSLVPPSTQSVQTGQTLDGLKVVTTLYFFMQARTIEKLSSELYSSDTHFVLELLQV